MLVNIYRILRKATLEENTWIEARANPLFKKIPQDLAWLFYSSTRVLLTWILSTLGFL
jgi:hypothetical protein